MTASVKKKLRVCMVAYAFYEVDNRIRRYAETLVRRGDEVEACTIGHPGQQPREVICGVTVHRIQCRRIDEHSRWSYLIRLISFLFRSTWFITIRHIRKRYDLLHVHTVPDFEVWAAIPARLLGARIILDIHDIGPEFYQSKFKLRFGSPTVRILRLVERICCACADHVIISNQLWYNKLVARSVSKQRCTSIINYPDSTVFRQETLIARDPEHFTIVYPGTLAWHQGVDLLLETVARLRSSLPNIRLCFYGKGPLENQLRERATAADLNDIVTFGGLVPLHRIAEHMSTADLGVVPKRADPFGDEAFSTKIMEFMALGVPVLAAETSIDRHYFNDTVVTFFHPGDISDLSSKISALAADPLRRSRQVREALSFVSENTWDKKQHLYLEIVDSLTTNRR